MNIKHIIISIFIIVLFIVVLITGIVKQSCEALEVAIFMALLFNIELTINVPRKGGEE